MANINASANHLPVELLCQVFDHLPTADQKTARASCSAWKDVLSIGRYTNQRMINLVRCLEVGVDLNEVAHYRCFTIGQLEGGRTNDEMYIGQMKFGLKVRTELECPTKAIRALRDFLWRSGVSQHIEELHLEKFGRPLSELFGGKTALVMPKLRVLNTNVLIHKLENLIAPMLEQANACHAKLTHVSSKPKYTAPLVNQLGELKLDFWSPVVVNLPAVLGDSFENLRRLTLNSYCKLETPDIVHLTRVVPQLTHLVVINNQFAIPQVLENVLPLAKNLEVLKITARLSDVGCLRRLTKLRELDMIYNIHKDDLVLKSSPSIELPSLERLSTVIEVAARLVTPKLQSLKLSGRHIMSLSNPVIVGFLAGFCHNLLELELSDMTLGNSCTSRICYTMPRLEALEMVRVVVKPSYVEWILDSLRRLRWARFENCRWEEKYQPDQEFYDALGQNYPKIRIEAEFTEVFPRLNAIIAKTGFIRGLHDQPNAPTYGGYWVQRFH